jgi:hypothetical protein
MDLQEQEFLHADQIRIPTEPVSSQRTTNGRNSGAVDNFGEKNAPTLPNDNIALALSIHFPLCTSHHLCPWK